MAVSRSTLELSKYNAKMLCTHELWRYIWSLQYRAQSSFLVHHIIWWEIDDKVDSASTVLTSHLLGLHV